LGENIHSICISENNRFVGCGAKNVSAIFDRESGEKIKICESGALDSMRSQKVVQRFVGGNFIGRWNKTVRIWKVYEDNHKTQAYENVQIGLPVYN
jgi:hypothetical protein